MNWIATPLTLLATAAITVTSVTGADVTLQSLEEKLLSIESRLVKLETGDTGTVSSYSYKEKATLEATNNLSVATTSATYVIRDGDTLGKIAEKHGIERGELLAANRLSEGQPIYIGETLMIPGMVAPSAPQAAPPAAPEKKTEVVKNTAPAPASSNGTHIVAKGDTLTSIAAKHGTSVASLKSSNGLQSDVISLGQKLTLPSASTKVAAKTPAPDTTTTKLAATTETTQQSAYEYDNELLQKEETYGYYTVRKNDNLFALGRDFFTNMAELQRLNRLGGSTIIHPGDELIVPTSRYNEYHNQSGVAQN